jgi:hypothetical protein
LMTERSKLKLQQVSNLCPSASTYFLLSHCRDRSGSCRDHHSKACKGRAHLILVKTDDVRSWHFPAVGIRSYGKFTQKPAEEVAAGYDPERSS